MQDGDNLEQTTGRAVYADCRIGEIRVGKGDEIMELRVPGGEHYLLPGQAWGDVDALAVQREMIRRTIQEHLDKEQRLRPHGIKVLSLFFIDAVATLPAVRRRRATRSRASTRGSSRKSTGALRQPPRLSVRSLPGGGPHRAPRTRYTTATSRSTRKAAGPTPTRTTRPTATTPSAPTT